MKYFELPRDKSYISKKYDRIVLVLGFFDGVHRGHQHVIQSGKRIAEEKGLPLAVMTFNRHPGLIFSKYHPKDVNYLTTNKQKRERMAALGVDLYFEMKFSSKIGALKPEEFIQEYIVDLNVDTVVAGFDYSFGVPGVATMDLMAELADDRFDVVKVEEVKNLRDEEISSTVIRHLIRIGDIESANEFLGYSFETEGYVIHGKARGRHLGFPTANVYPNQELLLPPLGVYITKIKVNDRWYNSMTSIGYNVTFGDIDRLTIECFILDFDDNIYGEDVVLSWEKRIRGEEKFSDLEQLIERLNKDEEVTRDYFD